jgi:predicted phosphodiesterase
MRFLQLSDIHLTREENTTLDPDRELRWGLMTAAREVAKSGGVDAILVCGDVAFSGARDEYSVAGKLLRDLASELNVAVDMIFVIPGNHDIDLAKTDTSAQRTLRSSLRVFETAAERDKRLREIAGSTQQAALLMEPLAEYLRFAAGYDCPTSAAEPRWERSIMVDASVELAIHGLNSVIASHQHDHQTKEPLVVGTGQVIFQPSDGRLAIALCHHPPTWVCDTDEIALRLGKALLQVTGHVHEYGVDETEGGAWLRAGALQPPRGEAGWQPHFSVIDISIGYAEVEVRITPWAWNAPGIAFEPGDPATVVRSLPERSLTDERRHEIEQAMARRRLTVHLAALSSSEILTAVIETELVALTGSADDASGDLAGEAVARAREAGRLRELWDEMTARRNQKMENPFA